LLAEHRVAMPVAMTASTSPLMMISKLFSSRVEGDNWEEKVESHFKAELSRPEVWAGLTSLNTAPNHSLVEGQLVKFRGMVQDMFDPEYYIAEYQVREKGGGVVSRSGRYRDTVQCAPGEEMLGDNSDNLKERQCLYCVSPPGEAGWVQDQQTRLSGGSGASSVSQVSSTKRSLEEEEEGTEMETESSSGSDVSKRQKSSPTLPARSLTVPETAPANLNLPLPSSSGRACIVKLYDVKDGDLKLQDLVEFVGVISLDPALAGGEEGEEEMMTVSPCLPPPSLVPRLHVLTFTPLQHNNPLLPQTSLPSVQAVARVELQTLLSSALLGDRLAAEYLLLHLISRVYHRRDVLVLGKLSLNLHNMTGHEDWPRRLATVLSLLTTNSHYLPLTRANLDTASLVPSKDYEANRVVSGALQLAAGTHLWLDETAMTDGQLGAGGVKNLTSLGNLITWQKLEYDFQWQKLEYDTDIPCLIMSEGRSMLPSDIQLMAKPDVQEVRPDLISKTFAEIGAGLGLELLDRLRKYLTTCRLANFELTEQVMKAVQDDFVSMRQTEQGISVEDFHSLLVLGRLVSISHGRNTLTPEDWEEAKRMERERKERAAKMPARAGASLANGMNVHLNSDKK